MFERPKVGQDALLVHLDFGQPDFAAADEEFHDLSRAAGARIIGTYGGSRHSPDARYYAGKGKAQEIADAVVEQCAELVIFNHDISPSQERNLEALFKCRVLDRSGLILDIFAQRARSHEGKLQVELAQLRHLSTRLVRGWSHLERQKGGIGLRGPGETQLETDRRLLGIRIKTLRERLDKVRRHRAQGRQSRDRSQAPTLAMVGYTNAGKSTLFNALTGAEVFAADQLFATLDPTLRRCQLGGEGLGQGQTVILADTVGFVRDLPHELVAAFHATLEETRLADLLIHVIDASDPQRDLRIEQVQSVLEEVGADEVPQIRVYNKIDLNDALIPRLDRDAEGRAQRVYVSAATGAGLDLLGRALSERAYHDVIEGELNLSADAGRWHAWLYEQGGIQRENYLEQGGWQLKVRLPRMHWGYILAQDGVEECPDSQAEKAASVATPVCAP